MDKLTDDMTVEEAEEILTIDPEPEQDPEAPHGRFANGRPRKSAPKSKPRPRKPVAPEKRPPARPRSGSPDYGAKIAEILMIPHAILTVTAAARKSEPLLADAVALSKFGSSLSEAGGRIAQDNVKFAQVLDRLTGVSVYGELMIVVIPLVLQLGVNHDRLAPVDAMGVVSRETLLAEAVAK